MALLEAGENAAFPAEAVRLARFPPAAGPNPYLDRLYAELRRFGVEYAEEPPFSLGWLWRARRDIRILHFQWRTDRYYALRRPDWLGPQRLPRFQGFRSWLRLAAFAGRVATARLLGYCLVWTIHEVYPPESFTRPPGAISRRIDRIGGRLLARSCDVVLTHDVSTKELARAVFRCRSEQIEVVPHASYLGLYPRGRPRAEVRRAFQIPPAAFTFLCFGALRHDKRIDLVLDAFCGIDSQDVALVIAGLAQDPRPLQRIQAAADDPRIRTQLGVVPHEDVRELFEAVDAAVLGRSESWTSGSLILALSLGVPVVAAAVPPYEELLGGGEAGWLFQPGDVVSLRAALEAAAGDPVLARVKGAAALKQAERIPAWPQIAERTALAMLRRREHGTRRRIVRYSPGGGSASSSQGTSSRRKAGSTVCGSGDSR